MMCLMALTMQAQKRSVELDFQLGTNVTDRGGSVSSSSVDDSTGYTDLGLPSGTKWKNFNATGFYTYDEAVSQFGNRLPTKEQWEELKAECQWSWNGSGYKVTGPNGNSIVLPASGYRYCDGSVIKVGSNGYYWSSTPGGAGGTWYLNFSSGGVFVYRNSGRCYGRSVRLVSSSSDYTDLGLPSGTKWKNFNATGFYTTDEASYQFRNRLPTKQQWEELKAECQWSWNGSGYKVTGPNGNSIVLPASGSRNCYGRVTYVGSNGCYWSSTPKDSAYAWSLDFYSGGVNVDNYGRCIGRSVRLVQD